MAPLNACQVCSPTEVFHNTRANLFTLKGAQGRKKGKSNICQCEICCCGILDHLLKKVTCDMKTYQVVNEVKRYGAVLFALLGTKCLEMMFTMLE